jgi:hypothetical protein
MVSIGNMSVTSVSNGYVRNGRQTSLVPYRVLSGRALTRTIHCLFFVKGNKTNEQCKRAHQFSSNLNCCTRLFPQSATYRLPRRSKENPWGPLNLFVAFP